MGAVADLDEGTVPEAIHHLPGRSQAQVRAVLTPHLVARYAQEDAEMLESVMAEAEATADDPALQLVAFLRNLEKVSDDLIVEQPACLFVSFIYERGLSDPHTDEVVRRAVLHWRERILAKLEGAAALRPDLPAVDLPSLADQVFTTIEGALLLSRALDDLGRMRTQLAHLRHYLELLFGLPLEGT